MVHELETTTYKIGAGNYRMRFRSGAGAAEKLFQVSRDGAKWFVYDITREPSRCVGFYSTMRDVAASARRLAHASLLAEYMRGYHSIVRLNSWSDIRNA